MSDFYLILVVILGLLAIADLVVGVSNDAVNFLNSAIGSKVVSFKTLMIIASLGVAFGAISSSGMMEVARKGIFNPEMFVFSEIMIIFMAVMITDILLLDVFNSYGLPTSTTVSIVFELLGAAVVISLIKLSALDLSFVELSDYINTSKATQIIFGIFFSVIVAFSIGALIQLISRIILSFKFEEKAKWMGSLFGGIALTSIFYFIVIKGLKGTPYSENQYDILGGLSISNFIDINLTMIVLLSLLILTILSYLFNSVFKLNIYTLIICVGTFALALAFAGNDLVNFIGVPIAGYESFLAWSASGVSAESFTMEILSEKVSAPTFILLGAGIIMVLTLWTSSKAKSVIKTSIDLSRQEETIERFEPNFLSRFLVRAGSAFVENFSKITPKPILDFVDSQYIKPKINTLILRKDRPAFDKIRASVNLVVAAILISVATSYKLPLSTTYVTFMVAMGTSLADKAWGSESAVYRVAGVINVIGGWLMTALIAFTASGIIVSMLYYFEEVGLIVLVILVGYVLTKNYFLHKERRIKEIEEEELEMIESKSIKGVIFESSKNITKFSKRVNKLFQKTFEGLASKDISTLKENQTTVSKLDKDVDLIANNVFYFIKNLDEASKESASDFHMKILGGLENITLSMQTISKSMYKHFNNNHRGLTYNQLRELKELEDDMNNFFGKIVQTFEKRKYEEIKSIFSIKESLVKSLNKKIKSQVSRTKDKGSGPRNTRLYFEFLNKTQNIVSEYLKILELYSEKYDKKIEE
ncbi:inorganic phosphate transporter [Flavobacteriales bacterium]|nr:inorganic phosphate transporter [Flavobacteriales bacterium]